MLSEFKQFYIMNKEEKFLVYIEKYINLGLIRINLDHKLFVDELTDGERTIRILSYNENGVSFHVKNLDPSKYNPAEILTIPYKDLESWLDKLYFGRSWVNVDVDSRDGGDYLKLPSNFNHRLNVLRENYNKTIDLDIIKTDLYGIGFFKLTSHGGVGLNTLWFGDSSYVFNRFCEDGIYFNKMSSDSLSVLIYVSYTSFKSGYFDQWNVGPLNGVSYNSSPFVGIDISFLFKKSISEFNTLNLDMISYSIVTSILKYYECHNTLKAARGNETFFIEDVKGKFVIYRDDLEIYEMSTLEFLYRIETGEIKLIVSNETINKIEEEPFYSIRVLNFKAVLETLGLRKKEEPVLYGDGEDDYYNESEIRLDETKPEDLEESVVDEDGNEYEIRLEDNDFVDPEEPEDLEVDKFSELIKFFLKKGILDKLVTNNLYVSVKCNVLYNDEVFYQSGIKKIGGNEVIFVHEDIETGDFNETTLSIDDLYSGFVNELLNINKLKPVPGSKLYVVDMV